MRRPSQIAYSHLITCWLMACTMGCALQSPWKKPPSTEAEEPKTRPDLVESDETFKQPLRPKSEKKKSKWDLSTYLDSRTQAIEDNLGI